MSDSVVERVLTPTTKPKGFTYGAFSPRAYIDLLRALVTTEWKIRYYHTVVGFGWAFVNPVIQMFVYAYIFGSMFGNERGAFKLLIMAGLLPWRLFADGLTSAVRSLRTNANLLKKAPFPSELLPLGSIGTALLDFLVVFSVYVIFLAIQGSLVWQGLPWVLAALVVEVVFLAGLALLASSLNIFFRDIEQLVTFLMWIWFFLTPIAYPIGRLGPEEAKLVLALNPMAGVVTTIQTALLDGDPPFEPLLAAALIATVTLALGWWVFRRLQYELPKAA